MLKAIDADLKAELKYCRDIIEDHPKNYQVRNLKSKMCPDMFSKGVAASPSIG